MTLTLVPVTDAARAALLAGDATAAGALVPAVGWPDDGTLTALRCGTCDRWVLLDGVVIGACGVKRVDDDGAAELGWGLVPPVHGRGLGSATVRLLVADALQRSGIASLTAQVDPANSASWRAALGAGFVPAGGGLLVLSPVVQPSTGD